MLPLLASPAYWPPELCTSSAGKPTGPTPAGDMWALGCVVYILLTGRHPFDDEDDRVMRRNVTERAIDWSGWPASAASKHVVAALLRRDPAERLTIEQLLQHLLHRWQFLAS